MGVFIFGKKPREKILFTGTAHVFQSVGKLNFKTLFLLQYKFSRLNILSLFDRLFEGKFQFSPPILWKKIIKKLRRYEDIKISYWELPYLSYFTFSSEFTWQNSSIQYSLPFLSPKPSPINPSLFCETLKFFQFIIPILVLRTLLKNLLFLFPRFSRFFEGLSGF